MKYRTKVYRTPVPRSAARSASNEVFNLVVSLVFVCVLTTALGVAVLGQDASKASDKPIAADAKPKAPESVTIPADAVKTLQEGAKDARIAQLEYENMAREIELAKSRLEKLLEAAKASQDAANAAFRRACVKAGIPASEVDQYEGTAQADGSLLLKRKAGPATK